MDTSLAVMSKSIVLFFKCIVKRVGCLGQCLFEQKINKHP